MKKKYYSTAVFPIQLLNNIDDLGFSNKEKDKVISLLVAIKKHSFEITETNDSFVGVPHTFMRKVFGDKYASKFINKLIDNYIIFVRNDYSHGNADISLNYCKQYRINSKYYFESYADLLFFENNYKSVKYSFELDTYIYKDEYSIISDTIDTPISMGNNKVAIDKIGINKVTELQTLIDLKLTKIDFNKLYGVLNDGVNNKLLSHKYLLNENITKSFFNKVVLYFSEHSLLNDTKSHLSYGMSILDAKHMANSLSLDLIEYKNGLYIMKESNFLNVRRNSMMDAYHSSINDLQDRAFRVVRGCINGRLETNITNIPSFLTAEIMRQNNLIEIDLVNSQFAVLAHIFKEQLGQYKDFNIFAKYSQDGNLYEFIQEGLGLSSRNDAKQTMFELMFSKVSIKSQLKSKLKTIFPNVVQAVDTYKENNGYNMFAVLLQRVESEIFIDGVLTDMQSKNIYCLTKHDSVIIKEKDITRVNKLIRKCFERNNFIGTIKLKS